MRFLRKHWKKLLVLLLFAGSFAAAIAWVEPRPSVMVAGERHILSARFSADGKMLITEAGVPITSGLHTRLFGLCQLWDVASGQEKFRFRTAFEMYGAARLSSDNRILVYSDENGLRVVDLATGEMAVTLESSGEFTLSPDGKTLAYFADNYSQPTDSGRLTLWDTATGAMRATIDAGYRCAFRPDGNALASVIYREGSKYDIVLWDALTGEKLAVYPGPNYCPDLLGFSDEGAYIYCLSSFDDWSIGWPRKRMQLIRVDVMSGLTLSPVEVTATLPQRQDTPRLTLHHIESDGYSVGRSVHVWDVDAGREWGPFPDAFGLHGRYASAAPTLLPDGKSLLVADFIYREINPWSRWLAGKLGVHLPDGVWGYAIKNLDVESGQIQTLLQHGTEPDSRDSFCVSPDGKKLALWFDNDESIYLWDIPPRKPWLRILAWSAGPVAGLLFFLWLYRRWLRRALLR